MNILVTGGAGFIGSNIVKALCAQGHQLTILDDFSTGYRSNLADLNLQVIEGSILHPKLLMEACQGKDAVFHLAASVGNVKSIEQPERDLELNYGGTLAILEAMRQASVNQLIYTSTAAGYGEPLYLPVDEHHPMRPDSPYGISKMSGEQLALCYGKLYGMTVTALRYFNVYGPNQRFDAYGNVIPIFVTRILEGQPLTVYGDGEQTRDFVHVADVVQANLLALKHKQTGYFNIATGERSSINLLLNHLRDIFPDLTVDYTAARKGEVLHSVADIRKAEEKLGYQPKVGFQEGLREYVTWMKNEQLVKD